jgi:2-polyprenyl-3-methyl-5-hydroxy-6-metoxy-1,4-benzoquinol methylase
MSNVNKNKWDESYDRNENHTLYPKEEVVKFLNRFVRKKLGDNKFIDILMTDREKLRGLDCGCGIGRMTMLLNEFNIDSYGVDISKVAIQKAKELFPVLSNKFAEIEESNSF